jgi:chromosome partitioning protein
MSRNTLHSSETAKGLGWPRALMRIGTALGWPGSVSRGTAPSPSADTGPDTLGPVQSGSPAGVAEAIGESVSAPTDEAERAQPSEPDSPPAGPGDVQPRVESGVAHDENPDYVGTGDMVRPDAAGPTAVADPTGVPRETAPDAGAGVADPRPLNGGASEDTRQVEALLVSGAGPREVDDTEVGPPGGMVDPRASEIGAPASFVGIVGAATIGQHSSAPIGTPSDGDGGSASSHVEVLPVGALVVDGGRAPDSTTGSLSSNLTELSHPTRPPGPRRAKFDQDEFDVSPSDLDDLDHHQVPSTRATLPRPTAPRVFVVANQKGGVGKTTTSVNLAAALALGGLDVLVIDLDPQGNASTALGIDHAPGTPGTYEVLIEGASIAEHLVASPEAPHLKVLPATIDLAGAEIQLVSTVARENRLRKALRAYLADQPVDYVFLDCPPSLGLITLNALVAASEILIPIQCEYYALEGVSQLVRTINLVQGELNEDLEVSTVLLTMYDARTRLAAQVADEVRAHFSEQTLPTVIPRSVRISEAPSYGQTVLSYHPDSAGAVSYLEAAHEIARRGAKDRHDGNR